MGVKGIGKILPALGALPVPESIKNMKKFKSAISKRIDEKKCIVIYPEAHVWPFYTKIRKFDNTPFRFPVELNTPSFAMTTTYYKRKIGKRPGINVYIDGPVIINKEISRKEKQEKIYEEIYTYMTKRSKESSYEYIKYNKL